MDGFNLAQAAARGVHLLALLSLFGGLFFAFAVARSSRATAAARLWVGLAIVSGVVWLLLQAAAMGDAHSLMTVLAVTPDVVLHTRFGLVLTARLAVLIVLLPLLTRPGRGFLGCAAGLAAIALMCQALLGHAAAVGGGLLAAGLVTASASHQLAAGVWFGSLIPLFAAVRSLPIPEAVRLCRRFSVAGLIAAAGIVVTAFVQAAALIGDPAALFGTDHGHATLLKLVLFVIVIGFAAWNWLRLTPGLTDASPLRAKCLLLRSISVEIALGTGIILAAGALASLVPGRHQPPLWPFAWRLGTEWLSEPALRHEVAFALVLAGAAVILVAASLTVRRARLLALTLAAGLVMSQSPSLQLMFVPAWPTSFQTSPTGFTAESIVRGHDLFASHCAACHGDGGQGDGPAGRGLKVQPADLTAAHLWDHSDGELFWWISQGITAPDGSAAMPGFVAVLPEDDRWALIDAIRAINAGSVQRRGETWPIHLHSPGFPVSCDGIDASSTDDLRGKVLRVLATDAGSHPVQSPVRLSDGVSLVAVYLYPGAPPKGGCTAASRDALIAFAMILGVPPAGLDGAEILVDDRGVPRSRWLPGTGTGPRDDEFVRAEARFIAGNPAVCETGDPHKH